MSSSKPSHSSHGNNGAAEKKRRMFVILGSILGIGILVWGIWYFGFGRWEVDTDDAYVQSDLAPINSQVSATVVQVNVREGDWVPAGTPLLQLDDTDAQVALAQAKAALANAVRLSHGLYTQAHSAGSAVASARAALQTAEADLNRSRALAQRGMATKETLSHAEEQVIALQNTLNQAEQANNTQQNLIAGTELAQQPAIEVAAAQLRAAYLRVQRSRIISPIDGYVAKRNVQVGQLAQAGQPLMAIAALQHAWVEANFKETQLNDLRIGQPVRITSDLYGSKVEYHGKIDSLGMGTGSAFSILPAQNATGNWIKVTQRVPVRIVLDAGQALAAHPLRMGLSVDAVVNVHDQSGPLLAAQARQQPVQQTNVFTAQLQAADALVAQIIAANLPQKP